MLGAYYAATDGVLTAMAAARLSHPRERTAAWRCLRHDHQSRPLCVLDLFLAVWTWAGTTVATVGYLGLLVAAIVVGAYSLPDQEIDDSAADRAGSRRSVSLSSA